MKASIKFDTKQKAGKGGFPVYLILRASGYPNLKKTICRAWEEEYDLKSNMLLPGHGQYDYLAAEFLNYHNYIRSINSGRLKYEEASALLFEPVKKLVVKDFYEAAAVLFDDTTNGKLYKTVCNNFNLIYPGIGIEEIDRRMVKKYLDLLMLSGRSANGVHTYLRTLDAIFKKISDLPSPFKGIRPKLVETAQKDLTDLDLQKIFYTRTIIKKFDARNTIETVNYYRYYYMLMFYLGGIDAVDLAQLRYDKNVVGDRVQFTRAKGGTNAFINNKILGPAAELLKKFDCWPYLVPIYKYKQQHDFTSNMNDRFYRRLKDLDLTKKPLTKSARYSFINRAQQLLIDERITAEIVGHKRRNTTSIYTNSFALEVRDAAHERIIKIL